MDDLTYPTMDHEERALATKAMQALAGVPYGKACVALANAQQIVRAMAYRQQLTPLLLAVHIEEAVAASPSRDAAA